MRAPKDKLRGSLANKAPSHAIEQANQKVRLQFKEGEINK